jgi:hypothetical protein
MALVHRTVTPRVIEANRRNARRSTGPRTLRAKANSRLNALKHGGYSAIRRDYFHFWLNLVLSGPWELPLRFGVIELPIPAFNRLGDDRWHRNRLREFIFCIAPYVRPRARAATPTRAAGRSAPAPKGWEAEEGQLIKMFFFNRCHDVPENTRPLINESKNQPKDRQS